MLAAPLTIAYQFSHSANMDPTFSPDGKEMVFISVIAGREQLMRRPLEGGPVRQLTRDEADHEDPAWSPDGKRVAFVLVREGLEQIQLLDLASGAVEPLTPAGQRTIHPDWSPDGRSIVYCTDDDLQPPKKNDSEIFSIDLQTRRATRVLTGGVNTYPVFSPDGKRLAFRRIAGEMKSPGPMNSEVFVANADGSEPRNVTNDAAFDGWPAWSPDGRKIAFASNRGNQNYQIWLMNPDGSGVQQVAGTEGRGTAPRWSRDGKAIYFTSCWKVGLALDCQIFAAPLEGFPR